MKMENHIIESLTIKSILLSVFVLLSIGSFFLLFFCLVCSNCIFDEKTTEVTFNPLLVQISAFLEASTNRVRTAKLLNTVKMITVKNYGQTVNTQYQDTKRAPINV